MERHNHLILTGSSRKNTSQYNKCIITRPLVGFVDILSAILKRDICIIINETV